MLGLVAATTKPAPATHGWLLSGAGEGALADGSNGEASRRKVSLTRIRARPSKFESLPFFGVGSTRISRRQAYPPDPVRRGRLCQHLVARALQSLAQPGVLAEFVQVSLIDKAPHSLP